MKEIHLTNGWIEGLSDGLTLPCKICNVIPDFDYTVDDGIWNKLVPKEYKLNVICLGCLDKLAHEANEDISKHIEKIYFTGINKTIELKPEMIFYYNK